MEFRGLIIASYQVIVEAKSWRKAKRKAKDLFEAESSLAKPENGRIVIGHVSVSKKSWIK